MFKESNQICRFFGKGKLCKYRDSCRFRHVLFEDSSPYLSSNQDEVLSSSSPVLVGESNASSISQQRRRYQDEVSSVSTVGKKSPIKGICHFYSRFGHCRYGQNCKYRHEIAKSRFKSETSECGFEELGSCQHDDLNPNANVGGNEEDGNLQKAPDNKSKSCRFFAKYGNCRYGVSCAFKHVLFKNTHEDNTARDGISTLEPAISGLEPLVTMVTDPQLSGMSAPKKENKGTLKKKNCRVCPYFKTGDCRWGQMCRFRHPQDVMEDFSEEFHQESSEQLSKTLDNISIKPKHEPTSRSIRTKPPVRPGLQKQMIRREDVTEEAFKKLRQTEIEQMKKRFPKQKFSIVKDTASEFQMQFTFCPTDPDWPFSVKMFELLITVPESFPEQIFTIVLPEQDVPETVRRYVEVSIKEWLDEKKQLLEKQGIFELLFRPFLRWFDKNLQDIVTEALRQLRREIVARDAGFEFIPAKELQATYQTNKNDGDQNDEDDDNTDQKKSQTVSTEDNKEDADDEDDDDAVAGTGDGSKYSDGLIDPEKKGTEIQLRNLQLKDVSTLVFDSIHIIIQCSRCKNKSEFSTPGNRANSVACTKCNATQILVFRPCIMHQFISIMGYLDLDNCTPFDLVLQESTAVVGCLNCSKENKIEGVSAGQVLDTWCRFCHQKLRIATESVHFTQLQPSTVDTDESRIHKVPVKRTRNVRDPAIQEGKSLPDLGTCKHYKKSFRWFRFPCCGMVYPCDKCHDEKEFDHEMKFANRIICGFCCKEQPYAPDRPCISCKELTTKLNSSHWEGGMGCRDRIKMSKNDSQKYGNMNKTVSKHSQNVKDGSNKKKTRLRHA